MSALSQLPPLNVNLALRQCHVCASTARRHRPIIQRSRRALLYSRIDQLGVRMSASSSNLVNFTDSSSPPKDELLKYSRAFWISESLIAWKPLVEVETFDGYSCYLYASNTAAISLHDDGISGFDEKIELHNHISGLPQNVVEKFPHIRDYKVFQVPPSANCRSLVKCQLVIAAFGSDGICKDATGLQLPGVLDELFSYDGPLGAHYSDDTISLYLWAPTAQSVRAWIYEDAQSTNPLEIVPLHEFDGVWTVNGSSDWNGCYYTYEVHVYHPSTLAVEKCFASDPYARGLSPNCQRTLFLDLASDDLAPDGWNTLGERKPTLNSFTDISIYELHVRDFSANDQTVHPDIRGGYLAFTLKDSAGMLHLQKLSQAGITHVHLLPCFQFAGVDDVKENWLSADEEQLGSFPPDSPEQQALITEIQDNDGYNWGYNPVLWGVPKGSYASDSNGTCRIIEFRKMVQSLNECGIRVILDVVYNHIHGSGPFDDNSILDKIVPGYYLRRNIDGQIENSTCVNNTASEHYMVERLIIDDLLNWAVNYKVDGFRFDLMGHIMKRTMVKARDILRNLTTEKDQIDGSTIYIYGEGWDFGEVANNGRGINASQFNISGTGIGSFNDRIRDAILGGSPFGHPLQQGFVTGLLLQPNCHDHGGKENEKSMLASAKDNIQIGMAANLRDFVFTNKDGNAVKGGEVLAYGNVPVAYASSPTETINYVSAHDNETLFDIVSMKTPTSLSIDERCRINHLATSIIALSQGIPFFHAGDELLRSKSMDRDSYNSGDWFNKLDFSYRSNNWGVGLPPYQKNKHNWNLIKPRLADPSFKPQSHHIASALQNMLNLLRIRYSSPLFRLPTSNSIQERVRFHNAGPSWVPPVIVMSIEDGFRGVPGLSQLDPKYSFVVVVFNCGPGDACFGVPAFRGKELQLHPLQCVSVLNTSAFDSTLGSFSVPALTTSVFVSLRN